MGLSYATVTIRSKGAIFGIDCSQSDEEMRKFYFEDYDTIPSTTDVTGITFESRSKPSGSSVQIPLTLNGIGKNALIESNTAREGEVIIALADSSGINGDGAVASVAFEVIGDAGATSYLTLEAVSVHNLDLEEIIPTTECGTFLAI